jgi:transcriptional regulator with XRE-family HTH domain
VNTAQQPILSFVHASRNDGRYFNLKVNNFHIIQLLLMKCINYAINYFIDLIFEMIVIIRTLNQPMLPSFPLLTSPLPSVKNRGDMMLDQTPLSRRPDARPAVVAAAMPEKPSQAASNRSPTSADGNVGRRIKDVRRHQGLTQRQIASRVGVTGAQFHRYEVGTTRVATSRLIAIATVLGVQPERLMSDAAPAVPVAQSAPEVATSGDLVELVELFSSMEDQRRRVAMVAFARSLAAPS